MLESIASQLCSLSVQSFKSKLHHVLPPSCALYMSALGCTTDWHTDWHTALQCTGKAGFLLESFCPPAELDICSSSLLTLNQFIASKGLHRVMFLPSNAAFAKPCPLFASVSCLGGKCVCVSTINEMWCNACFDMTAYIRSRVRKVGRR